MTRGRILLATLLSTLSLLSSASCLAAGQVDQTAPRLVFFERAQTSCKMMLLGSPEFGRALVGLISRTGQSLGQICECAAVYAVSQTSDDTMKLIMSGNTELYDQFARQLQKGWTVCIK